MKDAILDPHEFKISKEKSGDFIKRLHPTVEELAATMKSTGSIVVLSNESGIILQTAGDSSLLEESSKRYLRPGAYWSEKTHGTNTAGTVAKEKRSLAVLGTDHYLEANQRFSCVGSPIFNTFGELKGVLTITGNSTNFNPSMLNFVEIITRKIENNMLIEQSDKQIVISLHNNKLSPHEALIVVDQDGLITGMNRAAREVLPIHEHQSDSFFLHELIPQAKQLLDSFSIANSLFNIVTIEGQNYEESFVVSTLTNSFSEKTFINNNQQSSSGIKETRESLSVHFSHIIGRDSAFIRALKTAEHVASTNYSISITGESGTGKDVLSHSIHQASGRKDKPFVALNCGGITESLAESELFGYESGAFTGAKHSGHAGVFERANGGTLFLDEIAELPLDIQASLLRVLQDFEVTRIGGVEPIKVDVRLITATHTDLWEKVQEGTFRDDLFYRLQGVQVELPPLRERTDRLDYAKYFLTEIEDELDLDKISLSKAAIDLIMSYEWPGNVRQLKSALREAAFLASDGIIEVNDLPAYIVNSPERIVKTDSRLQDVENRTIIQTLRKTDGNISAAARILGIGRNTLYRKLEAIRKLNSEILY